jgi:hypothetical protein
MFGAFKAFFFHVATPEWILGFSGAIEELRFSSSLKMLFGNLSL